MSEEKLLKQESMIPQEERMPAERSEIIAWLKKVKFRRRLFGGVDERNVWKKISELDVLYTKALEAERTRFNALLDDYRKRYGPGEGGDPGG